jgi:hypothetical protein
VFLLDGVEQPLLLPKDSLPAVVAGLRHGGSAWSSPSSWAGSLVRWYVEAMRRLRSRSLLIRSLPSPATDSSVRKVLTALEVSISSVSSRSLSC